MQRKALVMGLLVWLAAGCTGGSHKEAVKLFYGECRLEVVSKTPEALIEVDGVEVGEGEVSLEVPCGEKRIDISKAGFQPFHKFFPVNKEQAVKVTVELQKTVPLKNEALSADLIESLKPKTAAATTASSKDTGAAAPAAPAATPTEDSVENWR